MTLLLSPQVVDVYVDVDGTSAVMVGTRILVLPALPTLLVRLVMDGVGDVEALAGALVERAGPPLGQDPDTATRSVVQELVMQGVLSSQD